MGALREKLSNMFTKVMAGTVTREEGTMLLNHAVKEDPAAAVEELAYLIDNPPSGVFAKTILHTVALAKNKAFFNLIAGSLDNKDEGVAILAAAELAGLKTGEARQVLSEHLDSEVYYVRKASSAALANGFGAAGLEILKKHIFAHPEPLYRITSAHGLMLSGRKGIDALMDMLASGSASAVRTAAEAIAGAEGLLSGTDIQKIIDALLTAGDRNDTPLIAHLLRAVASFKERARSFEGYVLAFEDYPDESVRNEAKDAAMRIRAGTP
ncbi:MAG: hypothetical protein HZB83_07945 [Deltaproteobacteria bacterium]|nr:hypothetical protein [Deltaproteobacteria bacterium]